MIPLLKLEFGLWRFMRDSHMHDAVRTRSNGCLAGSSPILIERRERPEIALSVKIREPVNPIVPEGVTAISVTSEKLKVWIPVRKCSLRSSVRSLQDHIPQNTALF